MGSVFPLVLYTVDWSQRTHISNWNQSYSNTLKWGRGGLAWLGCCPNKDVVGKTLGHSPALTQCRCLTHRCCHWDRRLFWGLADLSRLAALPYPAAADGCGAVVFWDLLVVIFNSQKSRNVMLPRDQKRYFQHEGTWRHHGGIQLRSYCYDISP